MNVCSHKANIKGDIESNQIDMLVECNVHVKSEMNETGENGAPTISAIADN